MINVDIPDPDESERLLTDIINKWATICGFLYASKILETYTIAKGINLAKAKSLRKEMQASKNE